MRGNITFLAGSVTQEAFKNCAPFTKCITKIDETSIDDAEDLDFFMSMRNLKKY